MDLSKARAAHRLITIVRAGLASGVLAWMPLGNAQAPVAPTPYTVAGDAIAQSLSGIPGDPTRGRSIVASRQIGMCLLCHPGPFPEEPLQGNLAPDLAGAGVRLSEGQLRLRVVDSRRLDPATLMPSYHRVDHLTNVGAAWRSKPLLTAQQIEDVVAFLSTLRD